MSTSDRVPDPLGIDAAKLMRLQAMLGAMLEEVRAVPADDAASASAADVTRRAVVEVGSAVPDAELAELGKLVGPLDADLSVGESRVIDAQLLGWLGGLAMQYEWEGMRLAVAGERARALRSQEEAAVEARRLARGVL